MLLARFSMMHNNNMSRFLYFVTPKSFVMKLSHVYFCSWKALLLNPLPRFKRYMFPIKREHINGDELIDK